MAVAVTRVYACWSGPMPEELPLDELHCPEETSRTEEGAGCRGKLPAVTTQKLCTTQKPQCNQGPTKHSAQQARGQLATSPQDSAATAGGGKSIEATT